MHWKQIVVPASDTPFVVVAPIGLVLTFLLTVSLHRHIGPTATRAMTRGLGMIQAAHPVQFVLTDLKGTGMTG